MTSALEELISCVLNEHFGYVKSNLYESDAFAARCRELDMVGKDLAATGWLCDGLAAAHISSSLPQVSATNNKSRIEPMETDDQPVTSSVTETPGPLRDFSPGTDTCASDPQDDDVDVDSLGAYFDDPLFCANLSKGKKRRHWDLLK